MDRRDWHRANQFQAGYIKHFNTLSTGSILLITIFLEKLFSRPEWKALVAVALAGFLGSVIAGAAAYSILSVFDVHERQAPFHLGEIAMSIMWLGFLIGMSTLAAFAFKNIY